MKTGALASIIIPTFNAGRYIREAIDSALAQTYENIEIIVVDDGSSDATKEIIRDYASAGKIKYMYQSNAGLAAARNAGIKNSRGEYIALLDADDIFLPTKIERQIAYLEKHPECDICYCDIYHFWDGRPEQLFKLAYTYYSGDEVLPNLIKKDFIAPLTMVIQRSVFKKFGFFDGNFRRSEDLEFLVRILTKGARICFLDEVLAKLRLRRADNLQSFSSQPEVKKTALLIFENLKHKLSSQEIEKLNLKKYIARYRLRVGLAHLENKDKKSAKEFIINSFDDIWGGKVLGYILWAFIKAIPRQISSSVIRYYHLKKQQTNLKPVK